MDLTNPQVNMCKTLALSLRLNPNRHTGVEEVPLGEMTLEGCMRWDEDLFRRKGGHRTLDALVRKGLIEQDARTVRLTATGLEAAKQAHSTEEEA